MGLNISIFLPQLTYGGLGKVHLLLAREFTAQGHGVEFILPHERRITLDKKAIPCPIVTLGTGPEKTIMQHIPASRALARHLRRSPPDVLLTANWLWQGVATAAKYLARCPCRLLVAEHAAQAVRHGHRGLAYWTRSWFTSTLEYRCADALIAVSHGVAEDIGKRAGIAPARINVIYNPLDMPPPSSPAALAAAEQYWPDAKLPRLVAIGRVAPNKNLALLLDAVAHLNRDMPVQVLIVGDGPDESKLRERSEQLGLQDSVAFAGYQADPMPFYRSADVFVLSSNSEGLPTSLLEALACGVSVVSTDCPAGPAEILDNGRLGTLVPMRDASALAAGIRTELATKRNPETLITRAAEFSSDTAVNKYLELMQ